MCGIIAVVRRQPTRPAVPLGPLLDTLEGVRGLLDPSAADRRARLERAAEDLEGVDRTLRGVPGLVSMVDDAAGAARIAAVAEDLAELAATVEAALDDPHQLLEPSELEATNAALIRGKDALWAIRRDRLRAAAEVQALGGGDTSTAGLAVLFSLHQALSALDRLEVRGRDSAGLEVQLTGHGLDPSDPVVARSLADRDHPAFTGGSARLADGVLVIVHKAAAEIGELGDNTAALRNGLCTDELLQLALASPEVEGIVLGHTRWASIGIISEPNAHPQSSEEVERSNGPFATAVLNGDVDNYADLTVSDGLAVLPEITTDAKVIPTLMSHGLADGRGPAVAFRETVARLEGSVAIGAATTSAPDRLFLALRGSGQALYVGLAEDAFIVASEPYGVVEETSSYLRMDGETPADPDNPTGSRGQIVELVAAAAGTVDGIIRRSYDGTDLPVTEADLSTAQITTRDIDRGPFPHFLLKEITDAPASFRKTLRGKLVEADGMFRVELGGDTVPPAVRDGLRSGRIERVLVIGQGTAAVAGQSLAQHLTELLAETPVRVEALPATELSGFRLRADMSDTLAVAISQSGTTTDTNRTVDLIRSRGALVVSIVNRRNSDLTDKSDGVLYTSDGRDVEMSVASTKAFYAQVAAGLLLGYAAGRGRPRRPHHRPPRRAGAAPLVAGRAHRPGGDAGHPAGHRGRGAHLRPQPSVLGHRRQRREPDRGPGAADQAVRALLQVHRLRRHRGQEAHRPVLRADDPGVRGGTGGLHRGRRGQGGRHLPGPQGRPHRDRLGGGPGLHRGARGPGRAGDAPPAGLRPGHHGGAPVRLRGGAGHRCPGPTVAGGPCRHRRGRGGHPARCR